MESNPLEERLFDVELFRPEDAEDITALFRSVYGEAYPVKLVYHPADLVAAFDRKENIPIVARTKTGVIIGYAALYRSTPNPELYEAGQGLVLADFRGSGVVSRMMEYTCEVVVPALPMESVFGEAVCNHVYTQKSWGKFAAESALEVDLMPEEAYHAEKSASGRVAVLPMFRNYRKRKQVVYLPTRYAEQLGLIYSAFKDDQEFGDSSEGLPPGRSRVDVQVFDFAKVARITVWDCGADFEETLAGQEAALARRGITVFQAWLNLSWPFVGAVTEVLRRRGYFFGGLLPRWFGTDGLLMQRTAGRPNWEGIHLFTDRARMIYNFVHADWLRVALSTSHDS